MDCEKLEQLSAFIDGELAEEEADSYKTHLLTCGACREARDQFLGIGDELRSVPAGPEQFARGAVLSEILGREAGSRIWSRRVAVPVPVIGLLVLALLLAGTAPFIGRQKPAGDLPAGPVAAGSRGEAVRDLSRLDTGGRAVLLRIPRPEERALDGEPLP